MSKKEIIFKHIAIIILIIATSIWAYTDKGEPLVALLSVFLEFFYFKFEIKKSNKENRENKENNTTLLQHLKKCNFKNNNGVITIKNNFQDNNNLTKEISTKEVSNYFEQVILAKTEFELQNIKTEIEFKYANKLDKNIDPKFSYVLIMIQNALNNLKDKSIYILVIAILFILQSLRKVVVRWVQLLKKLRSFLVWTMMDLILNRLIILKHSN